MAGMDFIAQQLEKYSVLFSTVARLWRCFGSRHFGLYVMFYIFISFGRQEVSDLKSSVQKHSKENGVSPCR